MKTFLRPTTSNDQEQEPGQRGELLLMMALYSNPKVLSIVRAAVERLTETLGIKAEHCRSIARAVREALTNIVRHSYSNRRDRPITRYFRKAQREQEGEVQHGLEIILSDRGHAMDIVEFSRKGEINRLRLVKYLGQASPSA